MFYIAEIGLNHNGDPQLAREMVYAAFQAGADAVKFQSIRADKLVSPQTFDTPIDGFGLKNVNNLGDFWNKVSIDKDFHINIKNYCHEKGLEFMSTPFDFNNVDLLDDLGVKRFKIASGDLTNWPLIDYIINKNKPILLSTGGATLEEVRDTVGFIKNRKSAVDLTLLHCVSLYPTPPDLANLQALDELKTLHNGKVGFSDHTEGFHIPLAAIARGAEVIEKHFTIDQNLPGPDQKMSATPDIFSKIVKYGNQVRESIKLQRKKLSREEKGELDDMRRSIVAARNLKAGTILTKQDLDFKRPGTGISPRQFEKVLGKKLNQSLQKDDQIKGSHLDDK